jgi:hypothetical protein
MDVPLFLVKSILRQLLQRSERLAAFLDDRKLRGFCADLLFIWAGTRCCPTYMHATAKPKRKRAKSSRCKQGIVGGEFLALFSGINSALLAVGQHYASLIRLLFELAARLAFNLEFRYALLRSVATQYRGEKPQSALGSGSHLFIQHLIDVVRAL